MALSLVFTEANAFTTVYQSGHTMVLIMQRPRERRLLRLLQEQWFLPTQIYSTLAAQ